MNTILDIRNLHFIQIGRRFNGKTTILRANNVALLPKSIWNMAGVTFKTGLNE